MNNGYRCWCWLHGDGTLPSSAQRSRHPVESVARGACPADVMKGGQDDPEPGISAQGGRWGEEYARRGGENGRERRLALHGRAGREALVPGVGQTLHR